MVLTPRIYLSFLFFPFPTTSISISLSLFPFRVYVCVCVCRTDKEDKEEHDEMGFEDFFDIGTYVRSFFISEDCFCGCFRS